MGYVIEVPIFGEKNNIVLSLPLMRKGAVFEIPVFNTGKQMDLDRAWPPTQQRECYLWDKVNIFEQNEGVYFLQCPGEHKNLDTGDLSLNPGITQPLLALLPWAKVSSGYTE